MLKPQEKTSIFDKPVTEMIRENASNPVVQEDIEYSPSVPDSLNDEEIEKLIETSSK